MYFFTKENIIVIIICDISIQQCDGVGIYIFSITNLA